MKDNTNFLAAMFLGAILTLIILSLAMAIANPPRPIDVYRGKTTLEITYRDTIPVDTVVIFKKDVLK